MTTSAQRDENRFSDDDQQRMRARLAETLREWGANATPPREWHRPAAGDVQTLQRIMAHAIGCTLYDLRHSELEEINAMISDARYKPRTFN